MADTPDPAPNESPGAPAAATLADTEYKGGRPFAFKTVDELKAKIAAYFDGCDPHIAKQMKNVGTKKDGEAMFDMREIMTEQIPYTITGLALALGVDRRTLYNYKQYAHYSNDIDEQTKQDLILTIAGAYQRVEVFNEISLHHPGKANGIKFNLVNNFDWQDKTIQENRTPKEDLDDLDAAADAVADRDAMAAEAAKLLDAEQPPQTETSEPEQPGEPGPTPTE